MLNKRLTRLYHVRGGLACRHVGHLRITTNFTLQYTCVKEYVN